MVYKKMETRDYLRCFITRINKSAGVRFNSSNLNSVKDCEEYILNLVGDLKSQIEVLKNAENNLSLAEFQEKLKEVKELRKHNDELVKDKIKLNNAIEKFEKSVASYEVQARENKKSVEMLNRLKKLNDETTKLYDEAIKEKFELRSEVLDLKSQKNDYFNRYLEQARKKDIFDSLNSELKSKIKILQGVSIVFAAISGVACACLVYVLKNM